MERWRRWRAARSAFHVSDAFCHGDHSTAEPSSTSAQSLKGPVQMATAGPASQEPKQPPAPKAKLSFFKRKAKAKASETASPPQPQLPAPPKPAAQPVSKPAAASMPPQQSAGSASVRAAPHSAVQPQHSMQQQQQPQQAATAKPAGQPAVKPAGAGAGAPPPQLAGGASLQRAAQGPGHPPPVSQQQPAAGMGSTGPRAANGTASPQLRAEPQPSAQPAQGTGTPQPPPPSASSPNPEPSAAPGAGGTAAGEAAGDGGRAGEAAPRKRDAIAAEAAPAADVVIPSHPKSDAVYQLLERAVVGNLLFEMLPREARRAVFESMAPAAAAPGTVLIRQGDEGSQFYILEKGAADVLLAPPDGGEPRKVHSYAPGSGFGELALLYSAPRAATVVATAESRLWVMERAVYLAIKRAHAQQTAAARRALVAAAPMLASLSAEHREVVADALEREEFAAGAVVFRQGETGDKFYLVQEGTVLLAAGTGAERRVLARVGKHGCFGERALVKPDTRAADAVAEGRLVCFSLRRQAFNELLGPIEEVWKLEALRQVPILFNLPEAQLHLLAKRMRTLSVPANTDVFKAGDPGDTFYVIEDGSFLVHSEAGEELARIGKGSCFGELALLRQSVRAATVTALSEGTLLSLTREDFDSLLGSLADIRHMWRFEALRMVPALAGLTSAQRSQLCPAMKPVRAKAGQTLLAAGRPATFAVVEAGLCAVLNEAGQEIGRLGPTMCMGEAALLGSQASRVAVKALVACDLLVLHRSDAVRILGPGFAQAGAAAGLPAQQRLQLSDLQTVARLGAGAFGVVTLVKHAGSYYALKQMSKHQLVATGLQEHVKREKQIMAECDCPFMVNLRASFADSTSVYMLLEAVMGGELFTYLQSRPKPLGEEQARFYAASVVLGLEYMQQRNIMWRDLKPENLLIDTTGYVKMADFGFAKKTPAGQKSYTLCGTPEYLAPELVQQAGHTRAVDWWALGVLVYEMVAGAPPFYNEDRVAMFKNICAVRFAIPPHFSKELADLVRRILVLHPAQRLGAGRGGAADVKAHAWFRGFDWDAFARRQLPAPYVPRVRNPEDTSNFSAQPPDGGPRPSALRYQSTGAFKDF